MTATLKLIFQAMVEESSVQNADAVAVAVASQDGNLPISAVCFSLSNKNACARAMTSPRSLALSVSFVL